MRHLIAIMLIGTASSIGAEGFKHPANVHSHKSELGDVHLVHAWAQATNADKALVFVEIENQGDAPVTLLGAESRIAQSVELVGFRLDGGTERYVPLPMLPISARAEMVLAPNGAAFRLNGISEHLHEGDAFVLRITFDQGDVDMVVQVEAEDATQHSHAGHNH